MIDMNDPEAVNAEFDRIMHFNGYVAESTARRREIARFTALARGCARARSPKRGSALPCAAPTPAGSRASQPGGPVPSGDGPDPTMTAKESPCARTRSWP